MKHNLLFALGFIALVISFSSCKKKDSNTTNNSNSSGAPTITSNYYFQANIDGSWVTYQGNNTSWFSGFSSSSHSSGDTVKGYVESAFITDLMELNSGGIGCVGVNHLFDLDSFALFNLFTLGSKSYGKFLETPTVQSAAGAKVTYVVNGVNWSSDRGSASQTGSTFSITEFKDNNIDSYSEKIVSATFSCKLYDGNGNSKTLTNGKFRGRIIDLFP